MNFGPHTKLDGQGRARREAARRGNSECKINLSIVEIPLAVTAVGLQRSGDWLAARGGAATNVLRCRPTDCHCCEGIATT